MSALAIGIANASATPTGSASEPSGADPPAVLRRPPRQQPPSTSTCSTRSPPSTSATPTTASSSFECGSTSAPKHRYSVSFSRIIAPSAPRHHRAPKGSAAEALTDFSVEKGQGTTHLIRPHAVFPADHQRAQSARNFSRNISSVYGNLSQQFFLPPSVSNNTFGARRHWNQRSGASSYRKTRHVQPPMVATSCNYRGSTSIGRNWAEVDRCPKLTMGIETRR